MRQAGPKPGKGVMMIKYTLKELMQYEARGIRIIQRCFKFYAIDKKTGKALGFSELVERMHR
jgi:hypothetical protein